MFSSNYQHRLSRVIEKLLAVWLLCTYLILTLITHAKAATFYAQPQGGYETLQIVAVLPNPKGSDSDLEWLQIYNSGPESLDLKLYSLQVNTTKKTLISYIEGENTMLPSNTVAVIARNPVAVEGYIKSFNNNFAWQVPTFKTSFTLTNSETTLRLSANNNQLSEYIYSDTHDDMVSIFGEHCPSRNTVELVDFNPNKLIQTVCTPPDAEAKEEIITQPTDKNPSEPTKTSTTSDPHKTETTQIGGLANIERLYKSANSEMETMSAAQNYSSAGQSDVLSDLHDVELKTTAEVDTVALSIDAMPIKKLRYSVITALVTLSLALTGVYWEYLHLLPHRKVLSVLKCYLNRNRQF